MNSERRAKTWMSCRRAFERRPQVVRVDIIETVETIESVELAERIELVAIVCCKKEAKASAQAT